MKRAACLTIVLIPVLILLQASCSDEGLSPCGTAAAVVNLEDGCGFGFQLKDGTRVQAIVVGCEDIFADYRQEGLKVLIGFEERTDLVHSCGLAKPVTILCLERADATQQ